MIPFNYITDTAIATIIYYSQPVFGSGDGSDGIRGGERGGLNAPDMFS